MSERTTRPTQLGPVPRPQLRRKLGGTLTISACIAILSAAIALPFGLHRFGGTSWSRLSDIGQAYGILAALPATLSLGLVAFSVFLQASQAKATQEHNARLLLLELVRLVLDDPRLQMWRIRSARETRRQQYANLWVMLWRTLYRIGSMNEADLRLTVRRELFGEQTDSAFGRRFWERTRTAYSASTKGRQGRRFRSIMEDEYAQAVNRTGTDDTAKNISHFPRTLTRGKWHVHETISRLPY